MTKFTYPLETGEGEDQKRGLKQLTKFTYVLLLETDEKDDQMRGFKIIDPVHVQTRDG